jgi:hypothetical protein
MESLLQSDSASVCVTNARDAPTAYFEQNLAFALADGLARVGSGPNLTLVESNGPNYVLSTEGEDYVDDLAQIIAALSNSTGLDIALSRYGYGYGMNTLMKKFAAAVLISQAAIALATVVVLALSKCISRSWSSVGELVALAINSKPTPRLEIPAPVYLGWTRGRQRLWSGSLAVSSFK